MIRKVTSMCAILRRVMASALAGCVLVLAACGAQTANIDKQAPGGDVDAGRLAITRHGCGSCHQIRGIAGANGRVGPPLIDYHTRHFIAGALPNTAENLVLWIREPQQIRPGSAMPDLDVSEEEAIHIAAYLYNR
jgi:cytochrome c